MSDDDPEPLSPLAEAIASRLTPCRLREYLPEDLEACLELYRSNVPEFLAEDGLERFAEFLQLGTSYFLVAEYDGDIVACGGLELVGDSDSALLVYSLVHRDWQRHGFGSTLLAARLALLEPEERPVEVWLRSGRQAAAFFGRFGFELHRVHASRAAADEASLWLSVDAEDVLQIRDLLEDRSLRIELRESDEEDDEELP